MDSEVPPLSVLLWLHSGTPPQTLAPFNQQCLGNGMLSNCLGTDQSTKLPQWGAESLASLGPCLIPGVGGLPPALGGDGAGSSCPAVLVLT